MTTGNIRDDPSGTQDSCVADIVSRLRVCTGLDSHLLLPASSYGFQLKCRLCIHLQLKLYIYLPRTKDRGRNVFTFVGLFVRLSVNKILLKKLWIDFHEVSRPGYNIVQARID